MRILRTVAELRATRHPARETPRIGLVPTMGFLHEGHVALIQRARAECEQVVVSLFVNPTQFDDAADLDAYPRDEARDAALAAEAGADLLFAPAPAEVYPDGFATQVRLTGPLVESLEGAHRGPEHFWGVATVVTKLFNMVRPDVAYFGQKDAQQLLVIRRVVADLDLPVRIEAVPTVREPDGLARSSRNVRLHGEDRERALALRAALDAAEAAFASGERDAARIREAAWTRLDAPGVEPEHLELVDPSTLAPLGRIEGDALVVAAARVGGTRLIDNTILSPCSPRG